MLDLFKSLVLLMKLERIRIDNQVFRLHYKVTVSILLCFSLLLTSRQYFGDPIDCIASSTVPKRAFDTYCWVFSTYTVKKHFHGNVEQGVAHPGVGPYSEETKDEVVHQKYYQWVSFVLCFQAILFYIPRCIWKSLEGGLVRMLAYDILERPLTSDKWTEKQEVMVDYLTATHLHTNDVYAAKFAITELMNFINVVSQIFFINYFLGGQFMDYGPFVIWNFYGVEDPMSHVFPKITKCSLRDFGPTGDIQITDAMCVLPLNIVNEKFYVFLWFWFVILAVLSSLALLYRASLFDKRVRAEVLSMKARLVDRRQVQLIVDSGRYGDWFLLSQLSNNMNPVMFQELLEAMAQRFANGRQQNESMTRYTVIGNEFTHSVERSTGFDPGFCGEMSPVEPPPSRNARREHCRQLDSTSTSPNAGTNLISIDDVDGTRRGAGQHGNTVTEAPNRERRTHSAQTYI